MKKISKATLQRFPIYLKALRQMKTEGKLRVSSQELSKYISIRSATIRRDFSLIGSLGRQGFGYSIDTLIEVFSYQLGVNYDEKIILIGCGNFARAILNYNKWPDVVGEIVCAFDIKPDEVKGIKIPVYNINDLEKYIPKGCRIAILTVSSNVQQTVDKLVQAGITGIVDFTHQHFTVKENIVVKYVDIVSTIQEIVFNTNFKGGNIC